jgi:hypothetical protein
MNSPLSLPFNLPLWLPVNYISPTSVDKNNNIVLSFGIYLLEMGTINHLLILNSNLMAMH